MAPSIQISSKYMRQSAGLTLPYDLSVISDCMVSIAIQVRTSRPVHTGYRIPRVATERFAEISNCQFLGVP